MRQVLELGIFPMAMLWRDDSEKTNPIWARFQRSWVRVQLIMKGEGADGQDQIPV